MFVNPRARATDPDTSHEAAQALRRDQLRLNKAVQTVVAIMTEQGPQTDFGLADWWDRYWGKPFSYSLPCKSRHWAREAGLVKKVGYGQHQKRRVLLWGLGRDDEFLDRPLCPTCHRPWNNEEAEERGDY